MRVAIYFLNLGICLLIFTFLGVDQLTTSFSELTFPQYLAIVGVIINIIGIVLPGIFEPEYEDEPEVKERDYPFETASFQTLRNLLILDGLPPKEIDHFRDCLYALEQHGYDIVDYGRDPVAPFTTDANRAFYARKIRESLDRMRAKGNLRQGRQPHSSPEQLAQG